MKHAWSAGRSMLLLGTLVACGGPPSTDTPAPSSAGSVAFSPRPSTGVPSLPVGVFAETQVQIEVFASPTVDAAKVDRIEPGQSIFILAGPEDADGNAWYLAEFPFIRQGTLEYVFGWVPAWFADQPALLPSEARPLCTAAVPDITAIAGMHEAERLECFGDNPITLVGFAAPRDPALMIPPSSDALVYSTEPAWLDLSSSVALRRFAEPQAEGGGILVHVPPGGPPIPKGQWVEVVGQFDHPGAADCARTPQQGDWRPEPREAQSAWCRQRLVVLAHRVVPPP